MSDKLKLLVSTGTIALLLGSASAFAQDAVSEATPAQQPGAPSQPSNVPDPATASGALGSSEAGAVAPAAAASSDPGSAASNEIVVTGFRQSLQTAARLKRDSDQVQDSIVAEDIGKLPDTNIAETLQRIPGVQISRNTRGEGNAYVVHGLKQVATTVNGRDLFTVTNRFATLLDFSADILSGVDVYKTATADQLEGGLGGLINIHMARPFDFKGTHVSATASGIYSQFHDSLNPRLSGIVSSRWDTGAGEFGALLGLQYEQVDSGGRQAATNAYVSRTDLYDVNGNGVLGDAADTVTIPTHTSLQYERGERRRFTAYSSLEWRPSSDLTFYLDGFYAYSGGHSSTEVLQINYAASDGATAIAPFTFKDGNIASQYSFANPTVQSVGAAADNPYRTYNVAFGGEWKTGRLTASGEFSYEQSRGPFYYHALTLQATAPSGSFDLSSSTPDASLSGLDPADSSAYAYRGFYDLQLHAYGSEPVIRGDLNYDFGDGLLKSIKAGVRYSEHRAIYDVEGNSYDTSNSGLTQPVADVTELTPGHLFSGSSSSINQWTIIQSDIIHHLSDVRSLVGISTEDPPYPALGHYNYFEKVISGYAEGLFGFDIGNLPIDGNFGVRVVNTKGVQDTYETDATGAIVPVSGGTSYTNALPSVNIRAKFTPNLFLRLAFSKAISRPEYNNLSPAIVLGQSTGGGTPTGSAGNPALGPVKANQYDASLEYYYGKSNYAALALFQKDVTGFVQSFSEIENVGGTDYLINRPRNSGSGTIRGFEVTDQQFLDFLPGVLNGLGVQGNFTYVDSKLTVVGQSGRVPAEGLSKYAYNVTGIYEKGPVSLHVSYNWRSKSVVSTSGDTAGRPLYLAPQDSLDVAFTYYLTKRISLKLDAVNVLKAYQKEYYGTTALPTIADQLDRTFQAGIHFSL